jgi:cytochrome c
MVFLSLIAAGFTSSVHADVRNGDADRGKNIFKKCDNCHMVGTAVRHRTGPPLNNIIHARAAGVAGFRYSKAMEDAAADGLHWTFETLDAFLEDPEDYVPKTKMRFHGLKSAEDRADVIAYLSTYSDDYSDDAFAVVGDGGFTVADDVLAIEGDVEYGAYLASECTTCHRADGDNDGIPSIIGWNPDDFVTAMHAYREKRRENPVMQMVAGRLTNDAIAALAFYFKSLKE